MNDLVKMLSATPQTIFSEVGGDELEDLDHSVAIQMLEESGETTALVQAFRSVDADKYRCCVHCSKKFTPGLRTKVVKCTRCYRRMRLQNCELNVSCRVTVAVDDNVSEWQQLRNESRSYDCLSISRIKAQCSLLVFASLAFNLINGGHGYNHVLFEGPRPNGPRPKVYLKSNVTIKTENISHLISSYSQICKIQLAKNTKNFEFEEWQTLYVYGPFAHVIKCETFCNALKKVHKKVLLSGDIDHGMQLSSKAAFFYLNELEYR